MDEPIPDSVDDRIKLLEMILLAACEGNRGSNSSQNYSELRRVFMQDSALSKLLPDFIRRCRDLDHFWPFIKGIDPSWAPRRQYVRDAMAPLFDHIERTYRAPVDNMVSEVLRSFDPQGVHTVWEKALERRHDDPEGAITSARTLLETVCKHILDGAKTPYTDNDLPALYRATAEQLKLAPSQHAEEAFKRILGGATSVVEGLGSLRNKIGDAHGQGRNPVKPSSRHAQLAVNMAGTMATFLIETWHSREMSDKNSNRF